MKAVPSSPFPSSSRDRSPDRNTVTGPDRNNGYGNRNASDEGKHRDKDTNEDKERESIGRNESAALPQSQAQAPFVQSLALLSSPKTPTPTSTRRWHSDTSSTKTTAGNGALSLDMSCRQLSSLPPFSFSPSPRSCPPDTHFDNSEPGASLSVARIPSPSERQSSSPMPPAVNTSAGSSSSRFADTTNGSPCGPGRRLAALHQHLQRSTTLNSGADPRSGSFGYHQHQWKTATNVPLNSSTYELTHHRSSTDNFSASTQLQETSGDAAMMILPRLDRQPSQLNHPLSISINRSIPPTASPSAPMRLQPFPVSLSTSAPTNTATPQTFPSALPQSQLQSQIVSGSTGQTFSQPTPTLAAAPDAHSGVIMASAGPALSSTGLGRSPSNHGWPHLSDFVRALFSQSLVSRLYSSRTHFFHASAFTSSSSTSSTSSSATSSTPYWPVVRILNTCHLLYLIPVTTVIIARLLTAELICDEQLFSWLTVQAVLFLAQIICACCSLQRQSMSNRVTMLDQRCRILLLVFMIWTLIGVGFLSTDHDNQDSVCIPSNDPVHNLAFKVIVFHVCVIGVYFMPGSSFLLARILPGTLTSGLSRTATKPMIDKLGSISMTEGMFGGDPEDATCAICLGDYSPDETIRFLPCQHHFHLECVDQWLLTDKSCPLCKHDIDKPVLNERSHHGIHRFQQSASSPGRVAEGTNNSSSHRAGDNRTTSPTTLDRFQIIVI